MSSIAAFPLSDRDKHLLSLVDEEHIPHTFSSLQEITQNNDLHLLTRYPSQLKQYIAWTAETKSKWGNMNNYLLQKRLHWEPLPMDCDSPVIAFELADECPLKDEKDFKILPNDWPYGITPDLTHIVVWLKHKLAVDTERGDLTAESRALVERFVEQKFGGNDRVVWWRNWTALQSVRGLDHIHVVMRDMVKEDLEKMTGEDGENIPGKPPILATTRTVP